MGLLREHLQRCGGGPSTLNARSRSPSSVGSRSSRSRSPIREVCMHVTWLLCREGSALIHYCTNGCR